MLTKVFTFEIKRSIIYIDKAKEHIPYTKKVQKKLDKTKVFVV